jgi:hypothetical protein
VRRQGIHRRSLAAIAVTLLVAGVAGPALPFAGGLGATCAGAAEGPSAGVVVDFGDVADAGPPPAGVVARCIPIEGRTTGGDALKAAGFTLRVQGGLVCAIDGYPASGCGERTGQRLYKFWSYWRADAGSGTYTYSAIGPAAARVEDGDIEGWRFVEGAATPNDPQPRHAPDHLAICGSRTPPSAVQGPSAAAPIAPSAPGEGAAGPDEGPDAPTASVEGATETSLDPAASTTTASSNDDGAGPTDDEELAFDETASTDAGSDRGGLVGALAVAALVAALGVGAFVRSRRSA